ncbi:type III PLP-dependent enzyme domain-containing protein [Arthrobacter antibioticus]|uniref:alanine racemase n=1 Tax=Arthrobacter sp. H35-MC1 TaxID=3046203 RepID=UPI0024B9F729|nr:alanine racemase [Arthrobacter sp. H35-MC1]MDJ0316768.1 alanine racemase [Arthrobacter sp. H35-MC1]
MLELLVPFLARGRAGEGAPATIWADADAACRGLSAPMAVLDIQALSFNAGSLLRRAAGKPIRLASKSIRSKEVLRALLKQPGFAGILGFTLPEALWLATDPSSVFTDIVVAYPTADAQALQALAADPLACERVTLMVDSTEQLEWMNATLAGQFQSAPIRLCLDLDASWRPTVRGRTVGHIGVYRSPLRTGADAIALALAIGGYRHGSAPRFRLAGIMAYEAQVAGLQDKPRSGNKVADAAKAAVLQQMQRASMTEITQRRANVVAAVRNVAELEFVNGGGTGSIELTSADDSVTELAAGSGFFGPALFDGYSRFMPAHAVGFAAPVVRRPGPEIVTVLGGGWIASGPTGPDRSPVPVYPPGLSTIGTEGAGEVQTPLRGSAAAQLCIGDNVWFRHAKSGEVCEHVDALELLDGGQRVGSARTYRGEGKAFV